VRDSVEQLECFIVCFIDELKCFIVCFIPPFIDELKCFIVCFIPRVLDSADVPMMWGNEASLHSPRVLDSVHHVSFFGKVDGQVNLSFFGKVDGQVKWIS
jgi:hypothetical protein